MTDADKPAFALALTQMATALREKEPDAHQMRTYFAALGDLEIEFVLAACEQLIRSSQWFPKSSEWRDAAAKVEKGRIDQQRAVLRKLPTPLCLECNDTGWRDSSIHAVPVGVTRCECQKLRRLEVLGRRPMAALPESTEPLVTIDAEAIVKTIASTKGVR